MMLTLRRATKKGSLLVVVIVVVVTSLILFALSRTSSGRLSSKVLFVNNDIAATTSSSSSSSLKPLQANVSTSPLGSHRVLTFGDSLTAGYTSGYESFPYATYLEDALNTNRRSGSDSSGEGSVIVDHRGMPGWTTLKMLKNLDGATTGLRSAIQNAKEPSLSIVIILTGTNDLGFGASEEEITQNILALHKVCYENGVPRTIAIGIPPSGYQSQNQAAADLANRINNNLQKFCSEDERATFFPFPFPYEKGGENWYVDNLHFTPKGYQVLGESLAPTVNQVLTSLEEYNHV